MTEWEQECIAFHGRVLDGRHAHWCVEWDLLPIDETCEEYHLAPKVPEDRDVPCQACGFFEGGDE